MDFALCREYKDAEFGLNRRQSARQYKSADSRHDKNVKDTIRI